MRMLPLTLFVALVGCPSTLPGDPPDPSVDPDLTVETLASDDAAAAWFDRSITIFGATVYAAPEVPEAKLLHAATVLAEYVDNDEDGVADDPDLADELAASQASLIMFASADALESSGLFEADWLDGRQGQDLAADETLEGDFDIALEEVLHLINVAGHLREYPEAFGLEDSLLTAAMDVARGGHFEQIPNPYPDAAWYHYDDPTCDYGCMAVEYLYWALTTKLGAQSDPDRCAGIAHEWEPCTPELLASTDARISELLADPDYLLPTVVPDGSYRAE